MSEIEILQEISKNLSEILYLTHVLLVGVCFNSAFVFCLFILHAKNQRDFI